MGVQSILFAAPCLASPDVTSRGGTLHQFHLSIRLCAAGRAVTGAEVGGSRLQRYALTDGATDAR